MTTRPGAGAVSLPGWAGGSVYPWLVVVALVVAAPFVGLQNPGPAVAASPAERVYGPFAPAAAALLAGPSVAVAPDGVAVAAGPTLYASGVPDGDRVRVAIAYAMSQLGIPYVWGGDGPASGEGGFDCSGLTTAAYAAAGVRMPRTAQTQFDAGPHVPTGSPLLPGDLVFYGTPSRVHHVGLHLGDGRMVNAPRRGKPVQVAFVQWSGDDYLGATRPAAVPGSLRAGPPPAPVAPSLPGPAPLPGSDFLAPPAPLPPSLPPAAVPDALRLLVAPDPLGTLPAGPTVTATPPPATPPPAVPPPAVPPAGPATAATGPPVQATTTAPHPSTATAGPVPTTSPTTSASTTSGPATTPAEPVTP